MSMVGRQKILLTSSIADRSDGPGIVKQTDEAPSSPEGGALNKASNVKQDQSARDGDDQSNESRIRLTLAFEQLASRATDGGLDAAAALLKAVAECLRLPR